MKPNSHPRRTIPGVNDVRTLAPSLAQKFSPVSPISPDQVTPNSNKKALFSCPAGHDWEARISTVHAGGTCTYCANLATLPGYNDLATVYPHLTHLYSPDNSLPPDQVVGAGKTKHTWRCPTCQGSWKSNAADLNRSRGCPYCNGWKTLPGYNDLKTLHPSTAEQWSALNSTAPDNVAPSSNKLYWWTCPRHGDWKAPPNRLTSGSSCPNCAAESFKSRGEQEVRDFLETLTPTVPNDRKVLSGFEIDIYLPAHCVAVEYNGDYWHSNKVLGKIRGTTAVEYHWMKAEKARLAGVTLAFIWDNDWQSCREEVKTALILLLEDKRLSPLLTKLEGSLDAAQEHN